MEVTDPNPNLGPQMLAIDTKRFKAYRLLPEKGDLKDWKAGFPQGRYVSPQIPVSLNGEDRRAWLFVVADHQCSNGPVLDGLGQSVFKPPIAAEQKLTCDLPGIWKSNFEKLYRFSPDGPGRYKGEQLEGNLVIDQMSQKESRVRIDYRFEGQKGTAQLDLRCQASDVVLQGTYRLPARSGEWIFTKIQNAKLSSAQQGRKLFSANCAFCHFTDSTETKVGPGLKGLFGLAALPSSGQPVNDDTVRNQIVNGGPAMPPFKHFNKEEVTAIIGYLKSL
jgi:cytochrome c5